MRESAGARPVVRSRGVQRVRSAIDGSQFVVVHAPVGYGKTTAVAAALAGLDAVAWFHPQPWQRDAFVPPFLEAVRRVREDAGRRAAALHDAGAEPERIGVTFAEELGYVAAPIVIVVDDAHHLEGGPFPRFVDALAVRIPPHVRLIVISRTLPGVALADRVADGTAVLVGAADLRFGDEDVAEIAAGAGQDAATIAALVERAEGWPVTVMLALRTRQSVSLGDPLVTNLTDRLLAMLSPHVLEVLETTAAFETVDPEIVDANDPFSLRRTFQAAIDEGALVFPVPDGYRVHSIVREALMRRLGQRSATAIRSAHQSAAEAYARAGRHAAALFHLERAASAEADRAYLRRYAARAIASGETTRLRACAGRVAALFPGDAGLLLAEALLALARGDDRRDRLERAVAAALDEGDRHLAFSARLALLERDLGRGHAVDAIRVDELENAAHALGAEQRAGVAIRASWFDAINGDFAGALARLDAIPDTGSAELAAEIGPLAAYALTSLGEFSAADERMTALVERLAAGALVPYLRVLVWAARLALLRGEAIAADDYVRAVERMGRPVDFRSHAAGFASAAAEAAGHLGDAERVRSAVSFAGTAASAAWYARDGQRIVSISGRHLARAHALDGALNEALSGALAVPERPACERAAALADASAYASLAGRPEAAELRRLTRAFIASVRPVDGADAITLVSAVQTLRFFDALSGDADDASFDPGPLGALAEQYANAAPYAETGAALRREAPLDTVIALVRELLKATGGEPRFTLALVLAAAMQRRDAAGAFGFLRERFPQALRLLPAGGGDKRRGGDGLVEPLTPREREILTLLAVGLTNKEIAQRLMLGTRTVETHVARILGKLGVGTRARAVVKAISLGLASETNT